MVVRVDTDGVRAAADALEACGARLSSAIPATVVAPAGGDAISSTGAGVINQRSAHLVSAAHAAVAVISGAAAALRASVADYTATDDANASAIAANRFGAGGSASASRPSGAAEIPPVPQVLVGAHGPITMPSSLGMEPFAAATALQAGDHGASAAAHAQQMWKLATVFGQEAAVTTAIASGLASSWESPAAASALPKVAELSRWLADASLHAGEVAAAAAAHAGNHAQAVATHPTPEYVTAVRSALTTNSARVAAGDTAAAPALAQTRAQWAQLITDSTDVGARYGASTTRSAVADTDVGSPPAVAAEGTDSSDPGRDEHPSDTHDKPEPSDQAQLPEGATLDPSDPAIQAEAQALAAQTLAAQQAGQFGPQLLGMGSQFLQQAVGPISSLASSAAQAVTTGMSPDELSAGLDTASFEPDISGLDIPTGAGDFGASGGPGDFGAGTDPGLAAVPGVPATAPAAANTGTAAARTAPTQVPAPALANAAPTAPTRPAGTPAMMPMMNPAMMGGLGGGAQEERPRNRKVVPDEPVYKDKTPAVAPVIGARKRTPPKPTPAARAEKGDGD
ncbi:PPE domain-containing protein [Nocardia brasiliensis]|uniref:PPE domain-containing protein n=1 Tax=Nocardia brasiliensis TaxID=37326 RepID=UPI002456F33E|nr:PPE domain-containing protein [Nocardia brasiliensis]